MTGFTEIAAAGPILLALAVCLLAGLVSFASPCVVPLVPGYLSYLAAVVGVDEQPQPGAVKAPAGRAVAGRRVGGVVRRRVHRGVPARHGRRAGHDHHVDHRSAGAAAGRRRADHRDGPGVRGLRSGAAASGPVRAAAVVDGGRSAAAGRGVRAGLDAVPGADADRGDHRRVGHRRRERGPRDRVDDRLLPGAWASRSCCWRSGRRRRSPAWAGCAGTPGRCRSSAACC